MAWEIVTNDSHGNSKSLLATSLARSNSSQLGSGNPERAAGTWCTSCGFGNDYPQIGTWSNVKGERASRWDSQRVEGRSLRRRGCCAGHLADLPVRLPSMP